jgi:SanA protein
MSRIGRTRRILLFWAAAALIAALESTLTASWLVDGTSSRVYSSMDAVPVCEAGMVLGVPKYSAGRPSPIFMGRIRAAAALYHAGKVRKLVVSGVSHPEKFNDEISDMTEDLVALGVPEDAVIQDAKGLRTLDSILRMRDVFGYDGFITISQRDHCERALYLADHHGISTVGFEAETLPGMYTSERLSSALYGPLSCVKAVLDIAVGRRAAYPTER